MPAHIVPIVAGNGKNAKMRRGKTAITDLRISGGDNRDTAR
jgi:hypothetical protein